ncbi:fumarate reductase flavoprotein subunit [Corynebacterium suranareeae]|uniref:Fumarate reductase flavoprotein subunit n=1 Tax=Corynebacterium suranareeae TaxID=2506452 RepID=A0A161JNF7_9CORY|nr:FAD-dependent oxidoreductase [Corynebacterium suranareeae]BAU94362.1 fumarate reductase flavoprotein subunit [Corynebacterium suranareeae]
MSKDFDVIVIGSGGAGLSAAISASEHGADVVILEAEPSIGGSTIRSAGVLVAAGTSVQHSLGVADSPREMYQHYMDLNQWKVLPGPVWNFCHESGPMFEWMLEMGLEVPAQHSTNAHMPGLTRGGVENNKRCHVPKGQGKGLVEVLDKRRQELGIPVRLNSRVTDLIIEDNRVHGVKLGKESIRAGAVIVASGGFARNQDLIRKYFPDALDAGTSFFAVAADGSRGDHLKFAEKHDLKVFGENWGLLLLTARFQRFHHWVSGFPPASRIYVDAQGLRCMDEDSTYAVNQGQWKAVGKTVWAVFDERARLNLPTDVEDWQPERILEEVDKGVVLKAGSLEELAGKIGVPRENLKSSVDRWNHMLPNGIDDDFRRHDTLQAKGAKLKLDAIEQGPFYAVQIVPGELVCTHTGLQINSTAQVVNSSGSLVDGLFAAGEAAGGILGERYVGAGNSVTNGLVLGKIAGTQAALSQNEPMSQVLI